MPPLKVVAELRSILYSGDGGTADRAAFNPVNPRHFGITVQVFIGEVGGESSDSFDTIVCSPSWFAHRTEHESSWPEYPPLGGPDTIIAGATFWFMRRWNQAEFETAVHSLCARCSPGPDWGSVASRIGRQIPWEFDYRYDAHVDTHFGDPFPPPRRAQRAD